MSNSEDKPTKRDLSDADHKSSLQGVETSKEVQEHGLKDEDDLDDLDDLLDDFADNILSKPPGSIIGGSSNMPEDDVKTKTEDDFNSEFGTQMEELMKDLKIDDPETAQQFKELVEQYEESNLSEAEKVASEPNFDNLMKETMERLKNSGNSVDEQLLNDKNNANPEDILSQLIGGLGASGADGDLDMSKLLVDMLEQLSSKEVLYEPIKSLHDKFPDYLEKNDTSLSPSDKANYKKQYDISKEIVKIFEDEKYDDDNKEMRENINNLLESLQGLGQPPSELIGEDGDFPGFGGLGSPGALGGSSGPNGLDFNTDDIPKDMDKALEEGCKQT